MPEEEQDELAQVEESAPSDMDDATADGRRGETVNEAGAGTTAVAERRPPEDTSFTPPAATTPRAV
ncbi:MAG TPA: hypothetical protein VF510_04165, partial [Ktedonobacterales bacterium]